MPKSGHPLGLHLDLIPLDLAWNDPDKNVARMDRAIRARLRKSPQVAPESRIFVFPELTLTGFVTENPMSSAFTRDSSPVRAARALARTHGVALVFGFPEKIGARGKPCNTLLFVGPDGHVLASYRKIHLFTAGKCPEASTYAPGKLGTLVRYRGWKIGFGICFDLRFAGLFEAYARKGADLVILPACWLGGPGKARQFATLASAHAILGQFYFAALNRSGQDPFAKYEGDALCSGPRGELCQGGLGFKTGCSLDRAFLEQARTLRLGIYRTLKKHKYL